MKQTIFDMDSELGALGLMPEKSGYGTGKPRTYSRRIDRKTELVVELRYPMGFGDEATVTIATVPLTRDCGIKSTRPMPEKTVLELVKEYMKQRGISN